MLTTSNPKGKDDRASRLFVAIVLGALVLLSMLAFLTLLPPQGEFLLRTLSIVFMCFVIYRVGLTRVMFGTEKRVLDLCIILSCLFLSAGPVLDFLVAPGEGGIVGTVLSALANSIDYATIYAVGTIFLGLLAVVLATSIEVDSPSVMSMLGEKGRPKHLDGYAIRTLVSFVLLVAFYIVVFDITLQWWSVITDTISILVIVISLAVAMMRGSTARLSFDRFLLYIESIDHKYYTKLVKLFHAPGTVLFGVAALLVFYPLSDLGVYLVPYVTNIPNITFQALGSVGHTPLVVFAYGIFVAKGTVMGVFASAAYVLNALAMIMALLLPALFWYRMFMKKTLTLSPLASAAFVAGVVCFLIAPGFSIGRLSENGGQMVGVDIKTNDIGDAPVMVAVLVSLAAGALVWLFARRFPLQLSLVVIGSVMAFLARYMMLYFSDVWSDMLKDALLFFHQLSVSGFLAGFLFICFLAVSVIFYVGSIAAYFYEVWVSLWHEAAHSRRL